MKGLAAILACLLGLGLGGSGLDRRAESGAATTPTEGAGASQTVPADRLAVLLEALWPLRLTSLRRRVTGFSSWAEADRRYVWLRTLFGSAGRLAVRQSAGRKEADAAFSGRMDARLAALNPPGASGEDAVAALGRALEEAVPEEGDEAGGLCPDLRRGALLRPVPGREAMSFDGRRAGRHGLALAAPGEAAVRAAAPGRVVFTGVLRGLGQVVILAHGDDCHTVYACLGQIAAAFGETVDQGQVLGRTGLCPPAKGPGVYFELRFHKKALNPAEWFAASP